MRVSIITTAYNSASTIEDTLKSVAEQNHTDIEHIIIDGNSSDNTLEIVKCFPHVSKIVSEPDMGIYDAMNKGIKIATGDIVGTLNSDDFFTSKNSVSSIVNEFDTSTDAIFGDIIFVDPSDLNKTVRYYSGKGWNPTKFKKGFMPPHPSFYLRKEHYSAFGLYQTDYKIASDYELLIRMLFTHKLKYKYIEVPIVTMRTGGVSTKNLKSNYILNKEIVRACEENGIQTNMLTLLTKYPKKMLELVRPGKKIED